jgi:hypothetical protein
MRSLVLLVPFALHRIAAHPALADEPQPGAARVQPKPADGDAPLARGFPDSTRPCAIVVKNYPVHRGAVARSNKAGVSSDNLLSFSPFDHIRRNRIEMTAPGINTYRTPRMIETPGATGEVTMECVYRTPEMTPPVQRLWEVQIPVKAPR